MDDVRRYKRRPPSAGSVDGMLPSRGLREISQNSARPTYRQTESPQVNNFHRSDGFHGRQTAPLGASASTASLDQAVPAVHRPNAGQMALPDDITAPKKRKKKKSKVRTIIKTSALVLAILLVAGGAYMGMRLYLTGKHVLKGGSGAPALDRNVDISKLNGEGDGRINILLVGKGGDNHPGGQLTDTMLLASIDPVQKQAAILSIPRDLWVRIDGNGYAKLNSAYSYGLERSKARTTDGKQADGIKSMYNTVNSVIGIPIHYYVMFDFTAYKELVDTVGGVDVKLDNAIYDPNFDWQYGRNALKLPAGVNHLNGTQALLLGRSRGAAGGYGVATDFDRNENQRKMLLSLKEKLTSAGVLSNPVKINQIIGTLGNHIQTSFSTVGELNRLNQIIGQIPQSSIASLDLVKPPHTFLTTSMIGNQSVVLPKAGQGNYDEIQSFVRNTLKDGFLQSESATVAVYNATNITGLAGKQANVLKSYGYNVPTVGDAPTKTDSPTTILVDMRNGAKKYTKHYLEQRFKTTAVSSIPDPKIAAGDADFVIIVGKDAATIQ